MSQDTWKKGIDRFHGYGSGVRRGRVAKRREVNEAMEYEEKLGEHQERFKCFCRATSTGPSKTNLLATWGGIKQISTNWNIPTGLVRCIVCNNWVCDNHIYKGICEPCAQQRI